MSNPVSFETIDQLMHWLESQAIDLQSWNRGGAKSVENLWQELVSGEAVIQSPPPMRIVSVVHIIIRQGAKILIEEKQEYHSGRIRRRGIPPAEKMKPGESAAAAAIRGIEEELGVDSPEVKILKSAQQPRQATRDSQSYPGLLTQYWLYEVEAEVPGLPDEPFSTIETSKTPAAQIRKHYWHWQPWQP
ncbi:NUDIX hydrolase [Romeria aff. gracilis LEGE 07310]|uniref:NUDIX hydrolase n=1 Tax=Vasconcelosia minhoensis LEGE 07310 TaxID=915328 RepID=A0A8J7AT26_9CYAN|nr:NUDIX hydrolase [Romeria gracilis]MBE9075888.1 NUDIX hydrolase [Romeria aff. gracilis LEGE 07310]